jgi:hypothetical protein
LNGDEGSVTVKGKSLDEDAVVAVAKSTAATGNGASASIQTQPNTVPTVISFEGDARKVFMDTDADKERVLAYIRSAYREVRE